MHRSKYSTTVPRLPHYMLDVKDVFWRILDISLSRTIKCRNSVANRQTFFAIAESRSVFLCLRQARLAGGGRLCSICPFVRPSVRSPVCKLMNRKYWKQLNRFWCQLAQVVHEARAWNEQLWGQEVKSQGHTSPKATAKSCLVCMYTTARRLPSEPLPRCHNGYSATTAKFVTSSTGRCRGSGCL